jgi:hypothetical protein
MKEDTEMTVTDVTDSRISSLAHEEVAGQVTVVVAAATSDGTVLLLLLSLPGGFWYTLAALHHNRSSSKFPYIPVSLAQTAILLQPVGVGSSRSSSSSSTNTSSNVSSNSHCSLLAVGTSDGSVLLYDVTTAVTSCAATQLAAAATAGVGRFTDLRQGRSSRYSAVSSSNSSSIAASWLLPVLQLPRHHQSGVTDMVLLPVPAANHTPCQNHNPQPPPPPPQQQQPQQQQQQHGVMQLLLITSGDDQAIAVAQLSLQRARLAFEHETSAADQQVTPAAAEAASTESTEAIEGMNITITLKNCVTCPEAHHAAVRALLTVPSPASSSHGAVNPSSSSSMFLIFLSVALDQRVCVWQVRGWGSSSRSSSSKEINSKADAAKCGDQDVLQLQQLFCKWTSVPEPEAIAGCLLEGDVLLSSGGNRGSCSRSSTLLEDSSRSMAELGLGGVVVVAGRGLEVLDLA